MDKIQALENENKKLKETIEEYRKEEGMDPLYGPNGEKLEKFALE